MSGREAASDGNFEERSLEGEGLALKAGSAGVDERLLQLLLDPWDPAVTYRTAYALVSRRDRAGVKLVLQASAAATDHAQLEWLVAAFLNFRADWLGAEDDFLRRTLGAPATSGDESLRLEAARLRSWLNL